MPFLTGLAIITLAPSWANIKLDAPGVPWAAQIALGDFAGLAALVAAAAILGRAVRRAAGKKRRRAADARLAALADPKRRWLAPSATFDPTPRAEPQMRRVQLSPATPQDFAATPAAAPGMPQAQPAATEPTSQAQPQTQSVSATLAAVPEAAQAPTAMPEPAAQAISVPAPEAVQAPPTATEPVPQKLPPTRSPLYAALRAPVVPAQTVPVSPVPLPKHVVEARLAGPIAPPLAPPTPMPQPSAPKPAYVPASPTFPGGHVLASGLAVRVFLRYRDAAGAVTDSIFQIYQVRASRPGGVIEQLHGHCFTGGAFRVVPMRDVGAVGDERTGHFVFDLDAYLLGTEVRPNPFGLSLTPRGKYISDPRLPLDGLAAKWQHWQGLLYAAVAQALRSPGVPHATPRPAADAGPRFLLRYIASDNAVSDRIVQLQAVSAAGDGTVLSIAAYCERAEATRTFLRHRIVALGDAATGALRDDIDAALRGPGARVHSFGPVPARSVGKAGLPEAMEQARQVFAAMAPDERLASATRPAEPTPPKEKRPRGRPRKNAAPPPE